MSTDRELVDTHLRNMRAEIAHDEKAEREREAYEVVTEEDGIIITSTDYTKRSVVIPGLESGPIFKKVKRND